MSNPSHSDIMRKLKEIKGIPGTPPNLLEVPVGCRFQARCGKVHDRCRQEYTRLVEIRPGHGDHDTDGTCRHQLHQGGMGNGFHGGDSETSDSAAQNGRLCLAKQALLQADRQQKGRPI